MDGNSEAKQTRVGVNARDDPAKFGSMALIEHNSTDRPVAWAWVAAGSLSGLIAALHTFVYTAQTMNALMVSNTMTEAQQGLRMMWHGMSAIAWTYPVVLLSLSTSSPAVSRPALGLMALFNAAQSLSYLGAALFFVADTHTSLLISALHAAVGVLSWIARPSRGNQDRSSAVGRKKGRLAVLWTALVLTAPMAIYHSFFATFVGWPADLLASATPSAQKQALYAMWLFSCVLFLSIPVSLLWSLRASASASRFILRYIATLIAALMVSWVSTIALGLSPDLPATGAISLALIVVLTALSVPSRPDEVASTPGQPAKKLV